LKKVLLVFGTRPEAIKMAPLVKRLNDLDDRFISKVCVTGQHREVLDQILDTFGIQPDFDLNIMKADQDLYDITQNVLMGMKSVYNAYRPDLVLVHGDTSTSFTAALSAFYEKIEVGHVEAGLRTYNKYSPFPEEMNRQLTSKIAAYHFSPTELNKQNLLQENIPEERILVTGNTGIDALLFITRLMAQTPSLEKAFRDAVTESGYPLTDRKYILVTGHRRENFGQGFIDICEALKEIALAKPDMDIVYPVHLNPNVQQPVNAILKGIGNIYLLKPLPYGPFVCLMHRAHLLLTDSGGIQEEAPALNKPTLVMRATTERTEALKAGTVKLTGTDRGKIVGETMKLLDDPAAYQKMAEAVNPYGDGKAAERIVAFLLHRESMTGSVAS
jgi:UDP-N-acetylglucosamine 2-epimerase (non-hydrolysing)